MNHRTATPVTLGPGGYATVAERDDLLQLLDSVDEICPGSGVPAGSATESEETVLALDAELSVENARALIERFAPVRRKLDAEDA